MRVAMVIGAALLAVLGLVGFVVFMLDRARKAVEVMKSDTEYL